jgi:hypothetical protein
MRKFLSHDTASGELRLVFTDLWDGQHERTEYRVIDDEGRPLRRQQERDGAQVYGQAANWHIKGPAGNYIRFVTEQTATGPTVQTPCPKTANRRRKCDLCQAG